MASSAKPVRVAVGVVLNAETEVLVAQRQQGQHLAGLWEFPGGKIEAGETCEQALKRELEEEVGIVIGLCHPFARIIHQYPEKQVELNVQLVSTFEGEAHGKEGQAVRWLALSELKEEMFPEANRAIIHSLQQQL